MTTSSRTINVPWEFIHQYVVLPKRTELISSFLSGHFDIGEGKKYDVHGIDCSVRNGRVLGHNPDKGTVKFSIEALAGNGADPLSLSADSVNEPLASLLYPYLEKVREEEEGRRKVAEAQARIDAEELRRQQRIEEEQLKRRQQNEEQVSREAAAWERCVTDLSIAYTAARHHFVKQTADDIQLNMDALMPDVLDWEAILQHEGGEDSSKLTPSEAWELMESLASFHRMSARSYLKPCGALRKLLEPQCVIAIGETLFSRGYTEIVPSYAGALMDLDYDHEAFRLTSGLWSEIVSYDQPEYLARTLHRACRRTGNEKLRTEVESFAAGKFKLGGNSPAIPEHLRKSRRNKLEASRLG